MLNYVASFLGFNSVETSSSSSSFASHFDQEVREDLVTMGQGEYIVFRHSSEGEKTIPSDLFQQIYPLLNSYSPLSLLNGKSNGLEICLNRYISLKNRVKELDSHLEIAFIPRTLYDLILLKQCVEEDVQSSDLCPLLDVNSRIQMKKTDRNLLERTIKSRNCWHLPFRFDAPEEQASNLEFVAFKLNNVIVSILNPSPIGFSGTELLKFTEEQIAFFQEHRTSEKINCSYGANFHSPTVNFQSEGDFNYSHIFPMALRDEEDVTIVKRALLLDCSKKALSSFFIYRGASLEDDACQKEEIIDLKKRTEKKIVPYSLSYGSSIFAGAIYDGGATAFHYMRQKNNCAYAISIPFAELKNSIFHIKSQHAVAQLFGYGETFHVRTKLWKNTPLGGRIRGIDGPMNEEEKQSLLSEKDQDEVVAEFRNYKKNAIILKQESRIQKVT